MRNYSAAPEGEERANVPCFDIEVQTALSHAAVLLAVRKVARLNGLSMRQQIAVWRPFQ